jgi:hypothetical protein
MDMGQNIVAGHLDDAQWGQVDSIIGGLEQALAPLLVSLPAVQRRRLVKMGDASEPFCRRTHTVMRDNTALVPQVVDVAKMGRDLVSHDALAERQARLARLMEKIGDTDMALGSDIMVAALDGYALLKRVGGADGLHQLRRGLSRRFDGQGSRKPEPAATV